MSDTEKYANIVNLALAKEGQASRIRLVPFDEIKLGIQRRDLVKGIIPRVGISLIWGKPKCGKSFWLFDLMMHVALGWEYRERRVNQGPVVYCCFEGQTGFEARVEAFRLQRLDNHSGPVPLYLMPVTLNLVRDHQALMKAIRDTLGDQAPVAVNLDTLNRSIGGSENSDEDMSAYIRAADAIRETFECAVVIVHHCGHEGTRPRGHSSMPGAIDAQIQVSRDYADRIVAELELAKDGPQGMQIVSLWKSSRSARMRTTRKSLRAWSSRRRFLATRKLASPSSSKTSKPSSPSCTPQAWQGSPWKIGMPRQKTPDALLSKGLVRNYGDRWHVVHSS
jgi:hypothetical protein